MHKPTPILDRRWRSNTSKCSNEFADGLIWKKDERERACHGKPHSELSIFFQQVEEPCESTCSVWFQRWWWEFLDVAGSLQRPFCNNMEKVWNISTASLVRLNGLSSNLKWFLSKTKMRFSFAQPPPPMFNTPLHTLLLNVFLQHDNTHSVRWHCLFGFPCFTERIILSLTNLALKKCKNLGEMSFKWRKEWWSSQQPPSHSPWF